LGSGHAYILILICLKIVSMFNQKLSQKRRERPSAGEGEAEVSRTSGGTFVPPNGPPGMAAPGFPAEPDGAAGKERSAQQFLR
jgi:hypothetical protein